MLWSDEVEIMEVENTTNTSTISKEERDTMYDKVAADMSPISRVNPRNSKTRVEDGEWANQ